MISNQRGEGIDVVMPVIEFVVQVEQFQDPFFIIVREGIQILFLDYEVVGLAPKRSQSPSQLLCLR